jgi:hypothetical protein
MGQPTVMKRSRVRIGGLLSALVVLQMLAAWPAHAEGATAASCLINMSVHVTPGVSMVPTSGVETTGGETGSIACTGTFNGDMVTGAGTFGYHGTFTGITCLLDGLPLSGSYSFTVPTTAGPLHFTGTITDSRIAVVDRFELTQPGAHLTGIASVVPINGTCLLIPTTDVLITIVGSFSPTTAGGVSAPTVTHVTPAGAAKVLGTAFDKPQILPVTGSDELGVLAVLMMIAYLLGGVALSWSRKQRFSTKGNSHA